MCVVLFFTFFIKIILAPTICDKCEYYEEGLFIREAEIIGANDAVVYVFDDYLSAVIEVDIFDEIEIPEESICVGNIAIYVIDKEATDADLLGIIKAV